MKIQRFYQQHQKAILGIMTGLLSIAYLFKQQQNFLIFNTLLALVAIIGEIPLFLRATSALKFKLVSIELLVTIAIIGAFFIQEFSEAGIVVWLFSLGNLLEELPLQKTRQSVKELVQLAPKAAYRIVSPEDRKGELVAIDDLDEDAYVLVRTGIKFQSMVKWLGRVATLTKSRSLARPHTKLKKWKFNLRGD